MNQFLLNGNNNNNNRSSSSASLRLAITSRGKWWMKWLATPRLSTRRWTFLTGSSTSFPAPWITPPPRNSISKPGSPVQVRKFKIQNSKQKNKPNSTARTSYWKRRSYLSVSLTNANFYFFFVLLYRCVPWARVVLQLLGISVPPLDDSLRPDQENQRPGLIYSSHHVAQIDIILINLIIQVIIIINK